MCVPLLSYRKHTERQVHRITLGAKGSPWRFVPQQHTFPFELLDFRCRLRKQPYFTVCNEGNSKVCSEPQLARCFEMGNSSEFLLLKEEAWTIRRGPREGAWLHSGVLPRTLQSENSESQLTSASTAEMRIPSLNLKK